MVPKGLGDGAPGVTDLLLLKTEMAGSRELLGWRAYRSPSVGFGVEAPEIPGNNSVL